MKIDRFYEYGTINFGGVTYQCINYAFLTTDHGEAVGSVYCIVAGDKPHIDVVDLCQAFFKFDNSHEELEDCCDWEHPYNVVKIGGYSLLEGRAF